MQKKYLFFLLFLYSCHSQDSNVLNNDDSENEISAGEKAADQPGITHLLKQYFILKDALVEADTIAADQATAQLISATDSLSILSAGSDSVENDKMDIYKGNIVAEAKGLLGETDLIEKRRAFSMISENLFPLLKTAEYSGQKVYQQFCPMAFNDDESATWLSDSREIVNPYLGKKHPKYASGMLHCGELRDSVSFGN